MTEKQFQSALLKHGKPPLEEKIQQTIVDLAEWLGYRAFRVPNTKKRLRNHSAVGYPDITIDGKGRSIRAEVKRVKDTRDEAQLAWAEVIEEGPGEYYVWFWSDWESGEIERVLR